MSFCRFDLQPKYDLYVFVCFFPLLGDERLEIGAPSESANDTTSSSTAASREVEHGVVPLVGASLTLLPSVASDAFGDVSYDVGIATPMLALKARHLLLRSGSDAPVRVCSCLVFFRFSFASGRRRVSNVSHARRRATSVVAVGRNDDESLQRAAERRCAHVVRCLARRRHRTAEVCCSLARSISLTDHLRPTTVRRRVRRLWFAVVGRRLSVRLSPSTRRNGRRLLRFRFAKYSQKNFLLFVVVKAATDTSLALQRSISEARAKHAVVAPATTTIGASTSTPTIDQGDVEVVVIIENQQRATPFRFLFVTVITVSD